MKRMKIVFLLVLCLAPFSQTYAGHKAKSGHRDKKKIHNLRRQIARLQHQRHTPSVGLSVAPVQRAQESRFATLWSYGAFAKRIFTVGVGYAGTIAGSAGAIVGPCCSVVFKMQTMQWAFEFAFKFLKTLAAPKELWSLVHNITSAVPSFPLEGTSYAYLGPCYEKAIATLQVYQNEPSSVDGLHYNSVEDAKAVHHAILVVLAMWLIYKAEGKLFSWIWSRLYTAKSVCDQITQTDV